MKKLHIEDKELKDLLKSVATEEPSSNFTNKLMAKVHEAANEEELRSIYIKRLSRKIAAIVLGAFIVNLFLMISAFLQGEFNEFYKKLFSQIPSHFFVRLIVNPIALTSILTLALAVWFIIYMQKNMYRSTD